MNLRGSYRALRDNSKEAMLSAIEVYNKPRISYRDEVFVILLVNAWELLLKAVLSRNGERIFYPKRRKEPYRTLSVQDATTLAKRFFPTSVDFEPVARNLDMLVTYRNNAIHFYNQDGFGVVVYGLAQTSIINYRDLMREIFGIDIADDMSLSLLPLSFRSQPDPIEFLKNANSTPPTNKATAQFLREISQAAAELEEQHLDTGRFLTVFDIKLVSAKKISSADVTASIASGSDDATLILERRVDPNVSHPLRQKDIVAEIGTSLHGHRFTPYTFQALAWKHDFRSKPHLRWQSDVGGVTKYSRDVVTWLKGLTDAEIAAAIAHYKAHNRSNGSR